MREVAFMSQGETLKGSLYVPKGDGPFPAVVMCHGLLSCRAEFGLYAERLASRGYVALAFDLRGHGQSGGVRGLVSQERGTDDAISAVEFLVQQPEVDATRIGILGHSLGATIALCAAARDPRIKCVIAMAVTTRIADELKPGEYPLYRLVEFLGRVVRAVTGKPLLVPYRVKYTDIINDPQRARVAEEKGFLQRTFVSDTIAHLLEQDTLLCAPKVRVPTLIMVGGQDRVVSPDNSHRVFEAINAPKEYVVVEDSGHSIASDAQEERAFEMLFAWLAAHL